PRRPRRAATGIQRRAPWNLLPKGYPTTFREPCTTHHTDGLRDWMYERRRFGGRGSRVEEIGGAHCSQGVCVLDRGEARRFCRDWQTSVSARIAGQQWKTRRSATTEKRRTHTP